MHDAHFTLCKVVVPVFMGNLLELGVVASCIDTILLICTIGHLWSASTYWNFLSGSQGGPAEWAANVWCLNKLSPISNDISTWLLHDLIRTMRLIAIKKLINISVSLSISRADAWWQMYKISMQGSILAQTFKTSLYHCSILVCSLRTTNRYVCVSPDIFLCVSAARYPLMYDVNYYPIHLIRTRDRIFPSVVQIILCTKWIWRWWLRSCIRRLRYWAWRDLSYGLRADLVGVLKGLSWSSSAGGIDSDTLSPLPCLAAQQEPFLVFLLGTNV